MYRIQSSLVKIRGYTDLKSVYDMCKNISLSLLAHMEVRQYPMALLLRKQSSCPSNLESFWSHTSHLKLLEDGIAEVLATNRPIADEATSLPLDVENPDLDGGTMTHDSHDSMLDEPLLTLGISFGGDAEEAERTLYYYAGQVRPYPN